MWRLAWRNLWRNRTRTAITMSAISLSLGLQLFSYGTADYNYQKMSEAAARTAGGSVLVHADGYWEARTPSLVIESPDAIVQAATQAPGAAHVLRRVLTTGLVSSPRGNSGIQLFGVEREPELEVQNYDRFITDGTFLEGDEKSPIVLGKGVVKDLGLELGDKVVLTATDPSGEVTRALFRLTGIMETGMDALDKAIGYTTLPAAQKALGLGDSITQIAVLAEDDDRRAELQAGLADSLGARGSELEILRWDQAMPEMLAFIELDREWAYYFGILIFLVVAFGIANTLLMSVMERVRELGLLSALGLTPARVASLILIESALLAAVSIVIGFFIGYGLHLWIAKTGIDFSEMSGGDFEISGVILDDLVIYSLLDPVRWLVTCAVVFVLIVLSALYPAWRATRLQPATAMRTYA